MIIRIVKMTFEPKKVGDFQSLFSESKQQIAAFEGCTFLSLHRDVNNPNIFFTISRWEDPIYLEKYRSSELFASVWSRTKVLFTAPAEAWSVNPEFVSENHSLFE